MNIKQKRFLAAASVFVVIVLLFLFRTGAERTPLRGFFIQMDGYAAAPTAEPIDLVLTYYGEASEIALLDTVCGVDYVDAPGLAVADFRWMAMQAEDYTARLLCLQLLPQQAGVFQTDRIRLRFPDDTAQELLIGNWTFDVGDYFSYTDKTYLNTYPTPQMTSNASTYPYDYEAGTADGVKLVRISGGALADSSLTPEGLPLHGSLPLRTDAPVQYIRPLLTLEVDGRQIQQVGVACCLGGLSVSDETIADNRTQAARLRAAQK